MRGLAEVRTREAGILDLLCWDQYVSPAGVLKHTDGAYSVSYRYRGPDLSAATPERLAALSRVLIAALDPLGDGWLVHFDLHRLPAPPYPDPGAFDDPFSRALDQERREAYDLKGARYDSRYYLTLSHRPRGPATPGTKGRVPSVDSSLRREEREIDQFLEAAGDFVGLLSTQLEIERLSPREQLRYLFACLHLSEQPVAVPRHPVSLEILLGGGDFLLGRELLVDGLRVVPIAIGSFPEEVAPGGLDWLGELGLPFRAVVRYLPLDRATARRAIGRRAGLWKQATLRWRDFLAVLLTRPEDRETQAKSNRFEPAMVEDTEAALYELEERQSSAGYLTVVLLTWGLDPDSGDPDGVAERAHTVLKALRERGYVAWQETWNAPEAFLSTLPGHGWYNVRRPMVTHRAAAAMAPVTSAWSGPTTHPLPALADQPPHVVVRGAGSTPFRLCLASGDVQHTLIVGPTGSGKSTLVNLLIAQFFRYRRAQVFAFDKGASQRLLAHAMGGSHYPLSVDATEADLRLAPLASLGVSGARAHAGEWIEELLHLQGAEVGPGERGAIARALDLLGASTSRSLSTFRLKVQSEPIRLALAPFCGSGEYAALFDAEETALADSPLTVFELEALLALRQAVVAPAVLHLFGEIERRLDGRPTLIVVEEAATVLGETLFARRLRDWLLQLRKKNAGVVLVTQMVSTLLESSLRDAVLENCPIRLYLPNAAAREPHTAAAYRELGLNERQVLTVASALPKRDYYVVTPEGSRVIQLDLSPAALEVLGTSGPAAAQALAEARAEYGNDWLPGFLAERGHAGFAERLSAVGGSR